MGRKSVHRDNAPVEAAPAPTSPHRDHKDGPKSPSKDSPPQTKPILHKPRESLLTEPRHLEASHYRGFYNVVSAGCVVWIFTLMFVEFRMKGRLVNLEVFHFLSSDYNYALSVFLAMVGVTYSSFILTYATTHGYISSSMSAMLFQCAQCAMFTFPPKIVIEREMPIVTSAAIVMEQIVLSMKMHSYFVTNQQLRRETRDLGEGPSEHPECYPNNVNLWNFTYYLVAPTLVYETTYPRNTHIRWGYFFYKAAETAVMMTVLYMIILKFIKPIYSDVGNISMLDNIMMLALPAMMGWFCVFYIVFEGILNCIAELTMFADREFYQDWWNSSNLDEFSRKWNKPVHKWLLRHIYTENLDTSRPHGKFFAMFSTFLFSAVLHEYVFAITFRIARLWMLLMMMSQIPSIYLLRLTVRKLAKKHTEVENIVFWVMFYFGFPLMQLVYAREYHIKHFNASPPLV